MRTRILYSVVLAALVLVGVGSALHAGAEGISIPLVMKHAPQTPSPTLTRAFSPTVTPSPTRTPTRTPTQVPSGVAVLSYCIDRTSSSYATYINGEVKNNTGTTVDFVEITANGRDASGSLVWTDWTYALVDVLAPGSKSPFWFIDTDFPDNLHHMEFVLEWDDAGSTHFGQELTVLSFTVTDKGYYIECIGEARNNTGRVVEYPEAIVSMYVEPVAGQKRLVGCEWTYGSPDTVEPGQTCTFSMMVTSMCEVPSVWEARVVADYFEW